MSNPVATFAQHNHITEAYRTGTASYAVADIARELVTIYGADITGPQAVATLADARAFAGDVIDEAGDNPTHAQLLAAHDRVLAGDVLFTIGAEDQVDDVAAAGPIVVVPCGAQKLDTAAPADQLYTSQHFQLVYRAACKIAADQGARVFILSALHGLIEPSTVLEPYDVKMGDAGSIKPAALAEQLAAINPTTITALLPRAYRLAMVRAGAIVTDMYANAPGIGYQRGVAARLVAA